MMVDRRGPAFLVRPKCAWRQPQAEELEPGQDDLSVKYSGVGLLCAGFCFMPEDSLDVQINLALSA
jgi:hypothetical protein